MSLAAILIFLSRLVLFNLLVPISIVKYTYIKY